MMLAISPLESITQDVGDNYSKNDLFQDIDFSDLFMDFDDDREGLPNLELDPSEILGELTANSGDGEEESCNLNSSSSEKSDREDRSEETDQKLLSMEGAEKGAVGKMDGPVESKTSRKPCARGNGKNPQEKKRKVKVDWTPELHRRFVQAVEQLGIDKAVPSRILELMGIDCLTRHNIASHLQKYRSHRKHLKAKEAETISWNQRRSAYGCRRPHDIYKRESVAPWLAPTIGFPPVQSFRPLHVWGHPTVDHTMMHVWPKHVVLPQPPPFPQWAPQHQRPPPNRSFWHHPHYPRDPREGWVANAPTSGAPCFPPPELPTKRRSSSAAASVLVIPHPYPTSGTDNIQHLQNKKPRLDMHPSGKNVDAAISEVLAKPWLPLPLRLKSPSVDSVLEELQSQGISKIPPSASS